MELANRLKKLLFDKQINASNLAIKLDIKKQSMSGYLRGVVPHLEFFHKLKQLYPEINLNYLIAGAGQLYSETYEIETKVEQSKPDDNQVEWLRQKVDNLMAENKELYNRLLTNLNKND